MRLEPINNPSFGRKLVPPALALSTTIVIASLLAMIAGANPFSVLGLIIKGAFGSKFALLETLNRATPLIFTGLAVAVAFSGQVLEHRGRGAALCRGFDHGSFGDPEPWHGQSGVILPVIALIAVFAGAVLLLVPCTFENPVWGG